MADRPATDIGLGNLMHLDGAHDSGMLANLLERVLQGKRVDHGRQHAHVIAGDAIHAFGGKRDTTEDVAAAYNHTNLDTQLDDGRDLNRKIFDALRINTERSRPGHRLAAQLQKDALVFRHGKAPAYAMGPDAVSPSEPANASPTLKRANRETVMFSPNLAILVLINWSTVMVFSLTKGWS